MRRDYNSFAPFYDLAMGDRKEVAHDLVQIFTRHHPHAKSLLELGSGTGSLIRFLSTRYHCTGLDNSSGMVREARKKVPGASFAVADISRFSLHQSFDIVLCAFDTINHITSFAKWRAVFKNAAEHLNPDGIFVFDINTEKKLTRYFEEPPFAERNGDNVAVFEVEKRRAGRFSIHVQVFKRKGSHTFSMREMVVEEATFPVPKIVQALGHYFKKIHILDLERPSPNGESEELYFICSHPR